MDEDHDSLMGIPDTGKGKGDAGGSSPSPPTQQHRVPTLYHVAAYPQQEARFHEHDHGSSVCLEHQPNISLHLTLCLDRRTPPAAGGPAAL